MKRITVCICTKNRPEGLSRLLESVIAADLSGTKNKYTIDVIVVENDSEQKSFSLIEDIKAKTSIAIEYYLEKQKGLCYARNRAVKESYSSDFIFFVDDDQIVDKEIFKQLVRCQEEFDSDLVYGRNPPIFKHNTPDYIKNCFLVEKHEYGIIRTDAPTNCLYIKRRILNDFKEPFDLRLNFIGCEDLLLTFLLTKKGYIIRNNPDAMAYEIIPNSRTTSSFLMKRSFRNLNSLIYYLKLSKQNINLLILIIKLPFRLLIGSIVCVPYLLFSKKNKLKGLLKISESCGAFYGLINKKYQFYK